MTVTAAADFIRRCIEMVWKARPEAIIETRMDGAFFCEEIIELLGEYDVKYTISVPFEWNMTISVTSMKVDGGGLWTRLRASSNAPCR